MIKAVCVQVNSPLVINCLTSFSLSSESGIFLAADKMVLDACGACLHSPLPSPAFSGSVLGGLTWPQAIWQGSWARSTTKKHQKQEQDVFLLQCGIVVKHVHL